MSAIELGVTTVVTCPFVTSAQTLSTDLTEGICILLPNRVLLSVWSFYYISGMGRAYQLNLLTVDGSSERGQYIGG